MGKLQILMEMIFFMVKKGFKNPSLILKSLETI